MTEGKTMDSEKFNKIVANQIEKVSSLLHSKNDGEYATSDKLHNFRVAADLEGTTMRRALGGMLAKHTVSLYDMLYSDEEFSMEKWEEKLNDHTVYLILLRVILEEEVASKDMELVNPYVAVHILGHQLEVGDVLLPILHEPPSSYNPISTTYAVLKIVRGDEELTARTTTGVEYHIRNSDPITVYRLKELPWKS